MMKSLAKYSLVCALAFILAGAAGYMGIRLFTQSAEEVVVPELAGRDIIYVLETLTRLGLNAKLRETGFHDAIPQYGVTFQDPPAGTSIKKGRDVVIFLSRGKQAVAMPDLRQMSLTEAGLILEERGIPLKSLSRTHARDTVKEHIIAQFPRAFDPAARDLGCSLLVSMGPELLPRVMPDMEGLPLSMAIARAGRYGLTISAVRSDAAPGNAPGLVLHQDPAFGSPVFPKDTITLTVQQDRDNPLLHPATPRAMTLVSHSLAHGYLKRHVRVETDMLGFPMDLVNEYMKPGTDINILIPAGIKTIVAIFVDQELIEIQSVTPWNESR